jgi:deoxyribonuclease-4
MVKHALGESDAAGCCSRTPPAPANTIGRSFEELRELIDLAGGDKRHRRLPRLLPHVRDGFDISTAEKVGRWSRLQEDGRDRRLRCLHVNDSMTTLGSNRDRHAIPGQGEIGEKGCAAFLSSRPSRSCPPSSRAPARAATRPTGSTWTP